MTSYGRKRVAPLSGRPDGPRWTAYRRALLREWGPTAVCYHCGHGFRSPELIEVQHLISPGVREDLGWDRHNLVPCHGADYSRNGGPNRRCPVCDLCCQAVAASNTAPRDSQGRALPFPAAYLAQKVAERQAFLRSGGKSRKVTGSRPDRSNHSKTASDSPDPALSAGARRFADVGRGW